MRRSSKMAALVIISFLYTVSGFSDLEDNGSWWVKEYGALTGKDHPQVSKARAVFEKVCAAADKSGKRFPKLLVLRKNGDPWAAALPDGTVLLTRQGLDVCYKGVDPETGNARLAFVLGHELAHLAANDFRHREAFEIVEKFGTGEASAKQVLALFAGKGESGNTALAGDTARQNELHADSYGLLYASMAGFDPRAIVNEKGNFFQDWVSQITGKAAYSNNSHPPPEQRAEFLIASMKSVANDIDLFDFGVRMYQLGRHDDALAFFEVFREKFPCREVFNNIGLVYWQKGMEALARSDPERFCRFRLSTYLDTETRANQFLADQSRSKSEFEQHMNKVIRNFEIACDRDFGYLPARVNLASALIAKQDFNGALSRLDEALEIKKDDPRALNNQAVALYLLGPKIRTDMYDQASGILNDVASGSPDFPDAFYNLGRIRAERKRESGASDAWKTFLKLEPTGKYADIARLSLGMESVSPKPHKRLSGDDLFSSFPAQTGKIDDKTENRLKSEGFEWHPLEEGYLFGGYFIGKGQRVLILEGSVELVEKRADREISLEEITPRYGVPCREFVCLSGVKTCVYEDFAFDVRNGKVTKMVRFGNLKSAM